VIVDLDDFKLVNDRYGHQAGDSILRQVAQALTGEFRGFDRVARYGGDEFVVLLPQTTLAEAAIFAERVRSEVEARAVHGFHPTVSIGVASLSRPDSVETDGQLLNRADAAAYTAKRQGGNRICAGAAESDV